MRHQKAFASSAYFFLDAGFLAATFLAAGFFGADFLTIVCGRGGAQGEQGERRG